MRDADHLRPKDIGRLALALVFTVACALGLQLLFDCVSTTVVGTVPFFLFLISQPPFARLRSHIRRLASRKDKDAFHEYFQN